MRTKYTVDYFIKKFSKIHYSKWTTGKYENNGKCCALGFCGTRFGTEENKEAKALINILGIPVQINDNYIHRFNQKTPRARILAALREAKEGGLNE